MTSYGKLNLLGMLLLPAAATLAAYIFFGNLPKTLATAFGLNLVPMLIGGTISGLLLRGANRSGKGQRIALWPTLVPAVAGSLWYLFRAIVPDEVAPGGEYIAGPIYLLMAVVLLGIVAWPGCLIARRL